MRRNNEQRLYNVIFPPWFFFLFPSWLWLLALPANFAIDSLVLWLSAKRQGIEQRQELWKGSILRVWLIGFASDFLGAILNGGLFFLWTFLLDGAPANGLTELLHPYYFPGSVLAHLPGVALAGWLIYFWNRRVSFRKCPLEPEQAGRVSLHLAIFTAPYVMLLPMLLR